MYEERVLVEDEKLGNVFICDCGIVHVNMKGVSLHFERSVFPVFVRMLGKASSRLMDETLRKLLNESE